MTRLSRTWTLAWAWAALFFIGMPKLARMAEAQAGKPKLLAMQGSTIGTIFCRPCDCPNGSMGGVGAPSFGSGWEWWWCLSQGDYPVHYLTGEPIVSSVDLASGGFGLAAQTRDWSTTFFSTPAGNLGPGWAVMQWPRIVNSFGTLHIVTGGRAYVSFYDNGPSGFGAQNGMNEKLVADTLNKELIFTDTKGNQTVYHDFTVTDTALRGQFKRYKDAAGNLTTVTRGTSGVTLDLIIELQRSFTGGGHTTTESWLYDYNLSGNDSGKLTTVTLRRQVDAGAWSTVRKVDYTYYSGSANGPDGYLQRAFVRDGSSNTLLTKYYRYWKTGNFVGGLKFVVEAAHYERAKAANGGTDAGVDSAADSGTSTTIDNFAQNYFEYDTSKRVTKEVVQGAGCSCSTNLGKGKTAYTYTPNTDPTYINGYNKWKQKTSEQFLDDDGVTVLWTKTVYTNYAGGVMLETFKDESQATLLWRTFYKYDATTGQLLWKAMPSAVTGHDEAKLDLLNSVSGNYQYMSDSTGLVYVYDYGTSTTATTTTAGDALGYSKFTYCKQGELGTLVKKTLTEYIKRTGDAGDTFPLARVTAYRDTGATQPIVTNFSYNWQGTTNLMLSRLTLYPAVPTNQNGYATPASDQEEAYFDVYGRMEWHRQGPNDDGTVDYFERDPASGSVIRHVVDANVSDGTIPPMPGGWYFSNGKGRKWLYSVDALGRTTKLTNPKSQLTYIVYNDTNWERRIYPGWNVSVPTGPTIVARQDKPGSYVETLATSATPTTSGGAPTGQEAIVTATLQTLSRNYLDHGDRVTYSDRYYSFTGLTYGTGVNIGTLNTHYYRTQFGYDDFGNLNRTQNGVGTIARTVYDRLSRVSSTWIGTNDTPPSGEWSPSNNVSPANMLKTGEAHFDADGVGDGNLTQSKIFAADTTSYATAYQYDFRNRMTDFRGPDNVAVKRTLDNLGQLTRQDTYADANTDFVIGSTELRDRYDTFWDDKGGLYQEDHYQVTVGVAGDVLTTKHWSDYQWRRVKTKTANGLFYKVVYNTIGEATFTAVSFDAGEADSSWDTHSWAPYLLLFQDTVLEEEARYYDEASIPVASVTYRLNDDALASSTWDVRVWRYDLANRLTRIINFGRDNGTTRYVINTSGGLIDSDFDGIPDEAENTPRDPNTSDDYIVTKVEYDAAGFQYKTTDNLGRFSQDAFDREGRLLTHIENYVNGAVGNAEYTSDRTTIWAYTNGIRLDTITAKNAKGSSVENQITKHLYESAINLSWPTSIIYPDSSDTTSASTDQKKFTYDRLGRRVTFSDQRFVSPNALTHTYSYDTAGRFLSDAITALPTGVDGAVRRIELGYDDLSRVQLVTSYDAATAGNKVNEAKTYFTNWRRVDHSEQSHVGAVVPGTSPAVQYGYQDGAIGGVAKYIRYTGFSFPGAATFSLVYYPAAGTVGDALNRPDNVSYGTASPYNEATQFSYTFFGATSIAKIAFAASGGLNLDYGAGSGGAYAGYDRFGRIANQKWQNDAGTTIQDGYAHRYDRVGNRLSRDLLSTQQPATSKDEYYVYDGLDRLSEFRRGTLTGTPPAITQAASNYYQQWTDLEPVGNWKTWKIDTNGGAGGGQLSTQTRKHNLANEIDVDNNDANAAGASITGTGVNWVDPTYDKAGNLKSYPKVGDELTAASRQWPTYDAWNRMVKLQGDTSGAPGPEIVEFQYDGLDRRIVKLKPNGSNWDRSDYYYNENWQCIQERFLANTSSKTTVATLIRAQYVWDFRYIDALAVRWRDTDGDGIPDEQLFYCQDANANVTALVNASGAVVERYNYDPYGNMFIYDATWTTRSTSSYANEILFCGYRKDPDTLLYHVRHRDYHPTLGRWLERDPVGYAGGMNLYQNVSSKPVNRSDWLGLRDGVEGVGAGGAIGAGGRLRAPVDSPLPDPAGPYSKGEPSGFEGFDSPIGKPPEGPPLGPDSDNKVQPAKPPEGAHDSGEGSSPKEQPGMKKPKLKTVPSPGAPTPGIGENLDVNLFSRPGIWPDPPPWQPKRLWPLPPPAPLPLPPPLIHRSAALASKLWDNWGEFKKGWDEAARECDRKNTRAMNELNGYGMLYCPDIENPSGSLYVAPNLGGIPSMPTVSLGRLVGFRFLIPAFP